MKPTLAFILVWAGASSALKMEPVDEQTPMIFNRLTTARTTYEDFKIVFYVDLNDYFEEAGAIKETTRLARTLCNKLGADNPCTLGTQQLETRTAHMELDDQNVINHRSTRALCSWCGTIQHYAYGVMDEATAQQWADTINRLGNETQLNHDLLVNQTVVVKTFLAQQQATTKTVEGAMNEFRERLNFVTEKEKELWDQLNIVQLIQLTSTAINEHARLHAKIRRTMGDTISQRLPEIVPGKDLKKQLKQLTPMLKITQQFPIDIENQDVTELTKYVKFSGATIDRKIIIEIQIPILEREQLNLMKTTTIPFMLEGQRAIMAPGSEYFLVNGEQTRFIPLTHHEIRTARRISDAETLYEPSSTIFLDKAMMCQSRILTEPSLSELTKFCKIIPFVNQELIRTVLEGSVYFVQFNEPTRLWETCPEGQSQETAIGRQLITLKPECTLRTTSVLIKPHRTRTFSAGKTITPELTKLNATKIESLFIKATRNVPPIADKPIVVANEEEMRRLIDESTNLVEQSHADFQFRDVKYDTSVLNANFSIGLAVFSSTAITTIIIVAIIIYIMKRATRTVNRVT